MTKKHSLSYVSDFLEERGFRLIGGYTTTKDPIHFSDKDGYKYSLTFDNFKTTIRAKLLPSRFFSSNVFTEENINLWLENEDLCFRLLGGKYTVAQHSNLMFKCRITGETWISSWNTVSNRRRCLCPTCIGSRRKTSARTKRLSPENNLEFLFPELAKEWDFSENSLSPSDYCSSSDHRAHWICSVCGNKWKSQIKNRSLGNGCPRCKMSWGEKRIEKFLVENEILYIKQYRTPLCKRKKKLPFDFYLESKPSRIAIEYNGEQHYRAVDWFGGEKAFLKLKESDQIKKTYCEENKIKLIIISYKDFDNIEKILSKELNL